MSPRRRALPLATEEGGRGRVSGWVVSVVVHVGLALLLLAVRAAPPQAVRQWVEMAVAEAPPPEAEPPPPPPEPDKPKPKPRKVDFTPEPVPTDPTPPPPDTPTQSVRRVQGLNSASFAPGSGSGLQVRAGTSLGVKATKETLTTEEAKVSWAAASTPPKCPRPALEAPASVKKAGLQGSVELLLDIGLDGRVESVRVTRPLHPDADAACVAAWSGVRCTPGRVGDAPVAIAGLPHSCTFRVVE